MREYNKQYKIDNDILRKHREAYQASSEIRERVRQARKKHYLANREARIKYSREYAQSEHGRMKRKENAARRQKHDIQYKIRKRLHHHIYLALNEWKKEKLYELLGCTMPTFIQYIESKWIEGMSWENYGVYRLDQPMTWHLDHVIPSSAFDLTKIEEREKCFHYTNLQPLWAVDNIRKGNKIQ